LLLYLISFFKNIFLVSQNIIVFSSEF